MKDWKTTLAGILIALGSLATQYMKTGTLTLEIALSSLGAALLGIYAADRK